MRKILFIILIILLLVGAGFVITKGFELGSFNIWGMESIINQNENIDTKNKQLSNLVSVSYPDSLAQLKTSSETLNSTKKDYEDKAILITNSSSYMQTEKYEIEYLWTKLGFYAKDENVTIKIDVVNSSTNGLYDLNFTIAGEYIKVTDFIYDIENDSKLGFKIEDFHMSSAENGVQGTFSCKEIGINIESIEQSEGTSEGEEGIDAPEEVEPTEEETEPTEEGEDIPTIEEGI